MVSPTPARLEVVEAGSALHQVLNKVYCITAVQRVLLGQADGKESVEKELQFKRF